HHDVHAIPELTRALLQGQGHAFDDHIRAGMLPALVAHGIDPARDALADPVVLVGSEEMHVARQNLLADADHLLRRQTGVDAEVAQRLIEAVDMLAELERAVIEGPRHIERGVTVLEAAVAEWNNHLPFRHILAVEVGDSLVAARRCGHWSASLPWMFASTVAAANRCRNGSCKPLRGLACSIAVAAEIIMNSWPEPDSGSARLYERAVRVLPGGISRLLTWNEPFPFYAKSGSGARVTDVDGTVRIDFVNNFASLIHGHSHPAITEAVTRALQDGTCFALPTAIEVEMAELLCERYA